jgi:hypothetical protein
VDEQERQAREARILRRADRASGCAMWLMWVVLGLLVVAGLLVAWFLIAVARG